MCSPSVLFRLVAQATQFILCQLFKTYNLSYAQWEVCYEGFVFLVSVQSMYALLLRQSGLYKHQENSNALRMLLNLQKPHKTHLKCFYKILMTRSCIRLSMGSANTLKQALQSHPSIKFDFSLHQHTFPSALLEHLKKLCAQGLMHINVHTSLRIPNFFLALSILLTSKTTRNHY